MKQTHFSQHSMFLEPSIEQESYVLELEGRLDGRTIGHLQGELTVLGTCTRTGHSWNGGDGADGRLCGGRSGLGQFGES